MQILVFGMHRSGTSAITRLINLMGAYFGPEGSASEITRANPKGFWERFDVYTLNDALLKTKGCAWDDLRQWSFKDAAIVPQTIASTIQKIILGMDAFRPWVLKDPRLCLLLPAWQPCLEVPIAVMVYRNPLEIAISLQNRNHFPLEYGLALWEYYAVGMLNATREMPRLFVQHAELMQRPVKTCEALFQQIKKEGVRRIEMPSIREIRAFIDPKLYRAKATAGAALELSPAQITLTEMLQGLRPQPDVIQVSEHSQSIIRAGLSARKQLP